MPRRIGYGRCPGTLRQIAGGVHPCLRRARGQRNTFAVPDFSRNEAHQSVCRLLQAAGLNVMNPWEVMQ